MTPIHHPACNAVLRRPPGTTEEECGDLPIIRSVENGYNTVTSVWKPSPEEAEAIAKGGGIALTIWGSTHPPLALTALEADCFEQPAGPVESKRRRIIDFF